MTPDDGQAADDAVSRGVPVPLGGSPEADIRAGAPATSGAADEAPAPGADTEQLDEVGAGLPSGDREEPSVAADASNRDAEPADRAPSVGGDEPFHSDAEDGVGADASIDADPSLVADPSGDADPSVDAEPSDSDPPADAHSEPRPSAEDQPPPSSDDQPPLTAVLEAVLLVTDEPVPAVTLAQVAERPTEEVEGALQRLAAEYAAQSRGFELRTVAGGWRLYTRADCAPYVERFVLDGQQARLTQAALETLAVIAYRQPVTRARVSAVRGVNVDGVVRTLVARGLVTEVGQDADSGATLYGTTVLLLEKLGLDSLHALPSLAPLLPELDDLAEGSIST